jgi:hypothetical protein
LGHHKNTDSNIFLQKSEMASISTTTINGNVTVIHVKEQRKCSLCGQAGHNKSNRHFHPDAVDSPSRLDTVIPPAEPTVTYWHPELFSGGGVMALPAVVGWRPGTDSLAYHAQMKQMFMYRYDQGAGVWRRT